MKSLLFIISIVFCSFCSSVFITDYASLSGKYCVVSKTIFVESGDTLIVPQGSYILFNNLCGITVSSGGYLSAAGSKDLPVNFTSVHDTSGTASPFDWNGIEIKTGAFGKFSCCFIAFSTFGITASDSSGVLLENCIFSHNGQWNFSVSNVVNQITDLQQYSYSSQSITSQISFVPLIHEDTIATLLPVHKHLFLNRRNLLLGGVGVVLAAAGSCSFYKSRSYYSKYNSYVPGNPAFDSVNPSDRQLRFNYLRKKYNTFSSIGWSCLGLFLIDAGFLTISVKF